MGLRSASLVLLFSISVTAQANSDWQFEVTPYLWAAKNEGVTGAPGATADVEIPFSDLWDSLEFAGMVNLVASKDGWIIFSEITALSVKDEKTTTSGPMGNINTGVDIDISGELIDLNVGHRLYSNDSGYLYGYVGVRYMNLESDFNVTTSPPFINIQGTVGDEWFDPQLGFHGHWKLTDQLALQGRGEAGGFGYEADESYLLNVTLKHRLSSRWAMNYFYRYMKIDFSSDSFVYDLEVYGPGIGASYAF